MSHFIEFRSPSGPLFLHPGAIEGIEPAGKHLSPPEQPASLLHTGRDGRYLVEGEARAVRARIDAALDGADRAAIAALEGPGPASPRPPTLYQQARRAQQLARAEAAALRADQAARCGRSERT